MDVGEMKPSLSLGLAQMMQQTAQHQLQMSSTMEQVNNVQPTLSSGSHMSDLSQV